MAVNSELVSEKIFNLLKGKGYLVKSFNKDGQQVIDPQEATRFSVAEPNLLVRMDANTQQISLSAGEDVEHDNLRQSLKELANDFLLTFDFRIFNKTIKPKAEKIDIAQSTEKNMADVMEGFGTMTGSSKTSYQDLDNIKIVVKHKKPVNEEIRGARSRNIHSVYIQRGEERFKMAENNMSAARAMARHIQKGGEVFDSIGTSITEMAQEYSKLQEFVRYVKGAKLVNEDNEEIVNIALENISSIRNTFKKLSGTKTYANTVSEVEHRNSVQMLEDDIDLESKFTETHFDDRVSGVVDSIKNAMARRQSFESRIKEAISKESFTGLKDLISENDSLDFTTPHARLGYQVGQMSLASQDPMLGSYLNGISKKLNGGQSLNQFEYSTVKSCLLSANEPRMKTSVAESAESKYEKFMEQFDIL
jgi:septation ring formation regulator EzrA